MPTPHAKQYAFQVWDGETFRTRATYDLAEDVTRNMMAHKQSMPNCPARIVVLQVTDEHLPEPMSDHNDRYINYFRIFS